MENARATIATAINFCTPGSEIRKKFEALIGTGMVTLQTRIRCEMALASLLKYGEQVEKTDDLGEFLEVWGSPMCRCLS